eukprot:TRINITY_DN96265_c0_g1_i1.p1 TRINITY_DN96265_c0_g1~~TRINITY_DN96265_c0_g1_i1.p1  ORF type:complete len:108 (-),score=26.53 TRINITY_DN96265_c0_g1_i1:113-436(-)
MSVWSIRGLLVACASPWVKCQAFASQVVLPAELQCSRSALTVEVPFAGADAFSCPAYFEARTCCRRDDVEQVWAKVEDMLQFAVRVLEDQARELEKAEDLGGLESDG